MQQYQWRRGERRKVKAGDAVSEIERIRNARGGLVDPQSIVDASIPDDAVLHPEFEWNDQAAANEYRKSQARRIVQTIHVISEDDGRVSGAPHYVSVVSGESRGYLPSDIAFQSSETTNFVLQEALSALDAWQRRYQALRSEASLTHVWNALDAALVGENAA